MEKEINFNPSGRTPEEDQELDGLLEQDNLSPDDATRARELLNKSIDQAFGRKQPVVAITHDGRVQMVYSRKDLKDKIARDKQDREEHQ